MAITSLEPNPFFTAFVVLLWVGFPLLTGLSGFLLRYVIEMHSLCGRFSRNASRVAFVISLIAGAASLVSIPCLLRVFPLLPVIPAFLLALLSLIGLLGYWKRYKKIIRPFLVIPALFLLAVLALLLLDWGNRGSDPGAASMLWPAG